MPKQQISLKQLAINKDSTAIVVVVGLASFILVFSLISSHALLQQRAYQAKVIGKKKVALQQLEDNAQEVEKLKTSYRAFAEKPENVLGGNPEGNGEKDGSNPRLVLDALPSKYDFPALTTSLEKVFKQYGIESITGTDDEVAQSAAEASVSPQPVEMPFTITITGNAQNTKELLQKFERSIRPIQVQKVTINGASNQLKIGVTAKTYFQPEKKFDVKTEKVK